MTTTEAHTQASRATDAVVVVVVLRQAVPLPGIPVVVKWHGNGRSKQCACV